MLVGCATSHPVKTLTPLDNGHEIRVAVGQVLVVELPSNHTTGFCWNEPSDAGSVLEKVGEPAYMQNSSPFGVVGAGGTEIWRFRAAKVGQQTLRLDYARPWEKNVAPAKTVSFDVLVGEE